MLSNRMLLGATQMSLPNSISFLPTALAGCKNVTDRQTTLRKHPSQYFSDAAYNL